MKRIPLKQLLPATFFAGASALLYASLIERLWFEKIESEIFVDSAEIPTEGLRILHLTDLHLFGKGDVEQRKLKKTAQMLTHEKLDLILITGDLIENDEGIAAATGLIQHLPKPRLGTFVSLGNHDYAVYSMPTILMNAWRDSETTPWHGLWLKLKDLYGVLKWNRPVKMQVAFNDVSTLIESLESVGAEVLVNRGVQVDVGDSAETKLWIAGIDDEMEGDPQSQKTIEHAPDDALKILLAHHPDSMLKAACRTFDVAFSGHVHGGQIRLPLIGALYTQGVKHLPRKKTSGWFQYGSAQTYIGKGWGEGTPLRFFCRPEMLLVTIKPTK